MNLLSPPTQSTMNAQPPGETDTRLCGRWLVLTRVVWAGIALLALGLCAASIPSSLASLHVLCTDTPAACNNNGHITPDYIRALQGLGLSLDIFATYQVALLIVFAVVYTAIGAVLFWRKSDDRMALFASLTLVTFPAAFNYAALATLPSAWWWPGQVVILLGNSSLFLFFYLFPTGRFVPRFTRWLWVGATIFWAVTGFFPSLPFRHSFLGNVLFLGFVGSLLVAQLYRYRRVSDAGQRQQTRWVVFGLSIGLGGFLALGLCSTFFPSLFPPGPLTDLITSTAQFLCLLFVPLSIGVAILRSRLFDIDSIINRTLVYGILTVSVVGLYVLVVGYLGTLFRSRDNLLISLVAAGLIAVLFHPLRALLQRGVNHLLYGQRDEPYTVITRLSQRLEVTLAPDVMLSTIVETVAKALKLPYVAILLQQEDTFALAARYGQLVGEPQQRVEERTRELSSLLEISHTVASTLHLKPLLGLILDQLKTVVDYSGSSILAVEGEDLVFLDDRGHASEEQLMQLHFPLTHLGPLWQTMTSRESPIIIRDVREDSPLAQAFRLAVGDPRKTSFHSVRACMIVPLVLRDRVIGMLVLTASEEDAFTQHHSTLALAIATQAAIAIENAQLYEQAQQLAAVEERQRLARELHDSVSQALYGIALGLHTARIQLDRDPGELPESLNYLLSLAEAALDEMRALIFELRPEALEREGLVSALSKQGAALQARYGMIVQIELCEEPNLPLEVKQALYRIAQEAMHNTVKHARARNVELRLSQTANAVILEVRDDGVGFDPLGSFPGHLGLHSMQERLSSLSGTLQIESAPGQGTSILVQVPEAS